MLRQIRSLLPYEDLLYVADSGYAPYGDRSEAFVMARVRAIAAVMLRRGVKALVVACNTATAVAVTALREQLDIPVIAIEPAVKPAAKVTRSGCIGVLATQRTLASERFSSLASRYGQDVRLILQPCPGFVEQVERGDLTSPKTREMVARYVEPVIAQGADTLVLGCTHYPFLLPVIQEVAGPRVTVLEPSEAVARQVRRRLEEEGLLAEEGPLGTETFWTSGEPAHVERVISRLWGKPVRVESLPSVEPSISEPVSE